jgi:hypothetical protein
MERVYRIRAESAWRPICEGNNGTCNPEIQWKDAGRCRRKALLAVLASAEVTVLEMDLIKSEPLSSVSQSIELRLKDGDIAADPDRIINWTVVAGSAAPWLSLGPLNGLLHSSESVAAVKAAAVGAGFGDTATTGPFNTTLTFSSTARLMKRSDFVNGTDQQTITVRLSIFAKPYVNETHVRITRSSDTSVGRAEPIEAGEKLMVSVKAVDFEGLPISRPDLQLRLEIRGNLNKNQSIPLQLKADGTNVYTANISETWVREPETIQSAAFGLFRLPCGSRPVLVALPFSAAAGAALRIHQRAAALARSTSGLLPHAGGYFRCHVFEATEDRGAQQQARRSRRDRGRDHHACASRSAVRPARLLVHTALSVSLCRDHSLGPAAGTCSRSTAQRRRRCCSRSCSARRRWRGASWGRASICRATLPCSPPSRPMRRTPSSERTSRRSSCRRGSRFRCRWSSRSSHWLCVRRSSSCSSAAAGRTFRTSAFASHTCSGSRPRSRMANARSEWFDCPPPRICPRGRRWSSPHFET